MTGAAAQAPGVVKVRLSGAPEDVAGFIRVVRDAADLEGFEVLEESAPYPNRRDPGQRVYLTLRIAGEGGQR